MTHVVCKDTSSRLTDDPEVFALKKVFSSPPSKYHAVFALHRFGTAEAKLGAISTDPERAYMAMLTKVSSQIVNDTDEDENEDQQPVKCGRKGCDKESNNRFFTKADENRTTYLPLCAECRGEAVKVIGKTKKRKKTGHPR